MSEQPKEEKSPALNKNQQLLDAVRRGSEADVAQLLSENADINFIDDSPTTEFAKKYGIVDSPLCLAIRYGNTALVENLIAARADPKATKPGFPSPKKLAVMRAYRVVIYILSQYDPEEPGNSFFITALACAIYDNRRDAVKVLLIRAGNRASDIFEFEEIREVFSNGRIQQETIQCIVDGKADIRVGLYQLEHPETAQALINCKADPNFVFKKGFTALNANTNLAVVKVL